MIGKALYNLTDSQIRKIPTGIINKKLVWAVTSNCSSLGDTCKTTRIFEVILKE